MVELDAYLAENDGLRTSVELCALHRMIYSAEVHAGRAPSFAAKFVVWNISLMLLTYPVLGLCSILAATKAQRGQKEVTIV